MDRSRMKRHSEEAEPSHAKKAREVSSGGTWKLPTAEVYVEVPRRSLQSCAVAKYEPVGDEITEDGNLRVRGETMPEEDDGQVPIRTLDAFSVFAPDTNEFVPFEQVLTSEDPGACQWAAVGVVGSYVNYSNESEGEEEDEDGMSTVDGTEQRVLLSNIIECDAHYPTKHAGGFTIDPKIYLRTEYAWYVVLRPASAYARFFRRAWTHHRVAQTLLNAVAKEREVCAADVVHDINAPPPIEDLLRPTFDALGVTVTEQELNTTDMVSYLLFVLDGLYYQCPTLRKRFLRSKLIQRIYTGLLVPESPSLPPRRKKMPSDPEKRVLQHKNPTCVTPRVNAVAQKLFTQALRVADMPTHLRDAPLEVRNRRVHHTDPTTVEWDETSMTIPGHYERVVIDGEMYTVGDIVIVEPGDDEDRRRAMNASSHEARCLDNELADTKWFCRICYMFEERDKSGARHKRFHARWLQHGSQTLLQEAAHSRCLFWLNSCDDLPLASIYSHCNTHPWICGEPAPLDDEPGDPNQFFIGPTWDHVNIAFVMASPEQEDQALMKCAQGRPCISCGLLAIEEETQEWRMISSNAIVRNGVACHLHDFVYIHQLHHDVLGIGQILGFSSDESGVVFQAEVQWYGRFDVVAAKHHTHGRAVPRDNRRLFQTGVVTMVPLEQITGKAYVASPLSAQEKEAFILEDDRFYCDLWAESLQPSSINELEVLPAKLSIVQCNLCMCAATEATLEREHLLKVFGPLRGLELFAGAGGLSTGMEMSGLIQTKWAVEFSPAAARTFRANHPDTIVYNQCSNKLLEHVIQQVHGGSPKPLKSLDHEDCQELPSLPLPGEVDFIYGGPPCQSFSMMNRHRRSDDIRSTLVCNMISYVEFYRPSYFLLENVVGLLSYKLDVDPQEGDCIKMGVVKFILSSLINLGYQVQFKVLQAGQHGAPQGRRRVIFFGARQDVPLPEFPLPQYAFPVPVHNVNLPTGEVLYPVTRQGIGQVAHQCAPLACVSVIEAISDLARFDWISPHIQLPATKEDIKERQKRLAEGIDQFPACKSDSGNQLPGYSRPVAYAQPPLSRYQNWLRMGNGNTVLYHYTRWYAPRVVERVVNIPVKPDADHEDLPSALRDDYLYDKMGNTKKGYRGIYGRINGNEQFITAMTTIAPNAKGGKVLHPDQKRIITVRECARAQGFPDKYKFLSSNKKINDVIADQLRQIGNAVPVPLALALGKAVGRAACAQYRERERQEQMARVLSPELISEG